MASTTYNGSTSQTTAYAASDVYTLNVATSSITNVSQQGSDVVISTGSTSLTITGTTLAALVAANFVLQGGGSLLIGDNTTVTGADDAGNAITGTASSDVILGLGGADTINGGLGDNLIFGGAGLNDSTDGGDQINTAGGNDRIYGNAGADTINSGSGNDLVYGGLGADSINVTPNFGQSVTVFGGGGETDALDQGNDTINVGASGASVSGSAAVYGNAGNDTLNVFSSGANTVYGGLGNDTIVINGGGSNVVYGGTNDTDSITVNGNGNNTIYGGSGSSDTTDLADNITVNGGGNNEVFGNGGNDLISVTGGGANTVYGGLGNDGVTVSGAGNNVVYGGTADTDTISVSGGGNNTVYGGSGVDDANDLADSITVSGAGNNTVYGNAGSDTIVLNSGTTLGNNALYGGADNDTISVTGGQAAGGNGAIAASSLLVQGGTGSDVIDLANYAGGTSTVYGGNGVEDPTDGADTIRGGGANDVIYGNGGADVISTGAGTDSIYGGAGVDRFLVNGGGNKTFIGYETGEQVIGNTGTNAADYTATVSGGDVVLQLGAAGRTLTFTNAANSIVNVGFSASNLATFEAGSEVVDNRLIASFGTTAQTLTGTAGADRIYSGAAGDTINAGNGNDTIFAGLGNDSIAAGAGADSIVFAGGLSSFDTVDGGAQVDVLTFTDTGAGTADLDNVTNVETIVLGDAVTSIISVDGLVASGETLTIDGGALTGTNTLTFNGAAELDGKFSITGGAGNDVITGGAGADTILGGLGNDSIVAGAGADSIVAGDGNDTVAFAGNLTTADTVAGGAGTDVLTFTDAGGATTDLDNVTGFETITLGNAATSVITLDGLVASGASLTIDGSALTSANALTLDGSAETNGTFSITGGAGNDVLTGGAGADTLNGGAGNDTITGGAGIDTINLGTGDDRIVFGSTFAAGNTNHDVVTGFTFGSSSADTYDIGFTVTNGTTAATSNLAAIAPVAVTSDGTATANDVIFTFSGAGDKLAAGTTAANAVANAVTALTSGTDFSSANIATGDGLVLVLDDGTNSFVFHYVAGGTAGVTEAGDLELIGVVNGQLASQVATGDFI